MHDLNHLISWLIYIFAGKDSHTWPEGHRLRPGLLAMGSSVTRVFIRLDGRQDGRVAGEEEYAADPCAGRGSAVKLVSAGSAALLEPGGGIAEEDPAPAHVGVGRRGLGLGDRLADS